MKWTNKQNFQTFI